MGPAQKTKAQENKMPDHGARYLDQMQAQCRWIQVVSSNNTENMNLHKINFYTFYTF